MRKIIFIIFFLAGISFGFYRSCSFGKNDFLKGEVLSAVTPTPSPSPTPTLTPTPTMTPTPTLIPTPTPIPEPTATPTATPIPKPTVAPEQIHGFIDQYAGQYGVDPHLLRHIAVCESGFNPQSKNLYYGGLYQFSANTWINYRNLLGEDSNPDLRFNAEAAVKTAAYVLSINRAYIWPNCIP